MNNTIFFFFYNLAHRFVFFDRVVIFTSVYFPYIVILSAGIFLLFHHDVLPSQKPFSEFVKKWKEILIVFFSGVLAWIVAYVMKIFIHAPRPFDAFPQVHSLFNESGYSFPSGHATLFAGIAFAIFFQHKKAGYLFMFFALLIGIARIIAGVHFPADILGGFVLGAVVAYLLRNVGQK